MATLTPKSLEDCNTENKQVFNNAIDKNLTKQLHDEAVLGAGIEECSSSLSKQSSHQDADHAAALHDLMEFKVCGEFMLTEIGHGLDARNIETTATLQPDGSFDLHSPNQAAWKAMPPTTPLCGMPRLASELLGKRYSVPKPRDPTSVLSRHELGLFEEAECAMSLLGGYKAHRSDAFNNHVLPKCRSLIEAIGHRMAYEAAKDSGCNPAVLSLYEKICMSADLSWYTENLITTRSDFDRSVDEAYEDALPYLLHTLEEQKHELKDFIYALVTAQSFDIFVQGLKAYRSNDVDAGNLSKL
ncbi:hypothetical protein TrVFT333_006433 [Trichoderma virens FT-333]|nr:hypothetical protein TrVFT333_006433 [Trichoderma virens FT-333]